MRIGIVSDTHGQTLYAQQAVRMLEGLDVERVIHCGDVGSAAIVPLFQRWPLDFVQGNVDDPGELEEAARACGQTFHGRFAALSLAGVNIAVLHGDDGRLLRETIDGGKYQLVCHGHTHVADQRRVGGTLVLNPGALYRANPHTIATIELPGLVATSFAV